MIEKLIFIHSDIATIFVTSPIFQIEVVIMDFNLMNQIHYDYCFNDYFTDFDYHRTMDVICFMTQRIN